MQLLFTGIRKWSIIIHRNEKNDQSVTFFGAIHRNDKTIKPSHFCTENNNQSVTYFVHFHRNDKTKLNRESTLSSNTTTGSTLTSWSDSQDKDRDSTYSDVSSILDDIDVKDQLVRKQEVGNLFFGTEYSKIKFPFVCHWSRENAVLILKINMNWEMDINFSLAEVWPVNCMQCY